MLNGLFWKIIDFYSVSLYGKVSTNIFKHYKPIIQIHEVILCPWKLPVTITSMQHHAIISPFLPLKKTYGFLKCNCPLLSAQHALRCYAKSFITRTSLCLPNDPPEVGLISLLYREGKCGFVGQRQEGGSQDSRVERETAASLHHSHSADLTHGCQVEAHHTSRFSSCCLPSSSGRRTAPV